MVAVECSHDGKVVRIEGCGCEKVEVEGFDGLRSRMHDKRYIAKGADGGTLFSVKRGAFGSLPFFVTHVPGCSEVKVSQEMEEYRIGYRIAGDGFSYTGNLPEGEVSLVRGGEAVARLDARKVEDGVRVEATVEDEGLALRIVAVTLAVALLAMRVTHTVEG